MLTRDLKIDKGELVLYISASAASLGSLLALYGGMNAIESSEYKLHRAEGVFRHPYH